MTSLTDDSSIGEPKIRNAAPAVRPGPPIPAQGLYAPAGACNPVNLDKLPRALAVSPDELNYLRELIAQDIVEAGKAVHSIASNKQGPAPQDAQLQSTAAEHLEEIDGLSRALQVLGVARLKPSEWSVTTDRAAIVRCAVTIGNYYEQASYSNNPVAMHRLRPLVIRLGMDPEA